MISVSTYPWLRHERPGRAGELCVLSHRSGCIFPQYKQVTSNTSHTPLSQWFPHLSIRLIAAIGFEPVYPGSSHHRLVLDVTHRRERAIGELLCRRRTIGNKTERRVGVSSSSTRLAADGVCVKSGPRVCRRQSG